MGLPSNAVPGAAGAVRKLIGLNSMVSSLFVGASRCPSSDWDSHDSPLMLRDIDLSPASKCRHAQGNS
jgi:hypothetical protein